MELEIREFLAHLFNFGSKEKRFSIEVLQVHDQRLPSLWSLKSPQITSRSPSLPPTPKKAGLLCDVSKLQTNALSELVLADNVAKFIHR